jgi:tRNA(Ile)-lysidine synthetase-like protein
MLPLNPYSLNPITIGDTKMSIPVVRDIPLVVRCPREGEAVGIKRGMTKQISKLWNELDVPMRLRDFSIILEQAGEKNTLILFLDEWNPMLIPLQGRIFAAQKPKLVLQMELRYGVTE